MKPFKRSESAHSNYKSKMKIKRESVKPNRESIARTPSIIPVDTREAPCGVYWKQNVPDNCRKGVGNSESARRAFVSQLTAQLPGKIELLLVRAGCK